MDDKNLNQPVSQVTDQTNQSMSVAQDPVNQLVESPDQGIEIPEEIKKFLEGIMVEAKINTDDEEMNKETLEDLFMRMVEFINLKIVDAVPEDKLEGLNELLLKNADQEEIDNYVEEALPDAQNVYNRIMLEFRDMYLGKGIYQNLEDSPEAVNVK